MALNFLAATYSDQGRWIEAEQLHSEVFESRKRSLGEVHPDTLRSMYNLAELYGRQRRWSEAEELGVQLV